MKKTLFIYILLSMSLWVNAQEPNSPEATGEFSNFEIIGFNDSSTYFSFAEYGTTNNNNPFANLFIIDIASNAFVPNGKFSRTYNESFSIEEKGAGALYSQLLQAGPQLRKYNINTLNTGRLIYVLLDGENTYQPLQFEDYASNIKYEIMLHQNGSGNTIQGATQLEITINNQGNIIYKKVGSPTFSRNVDHYKIRSIYTSLDNSALVFVIEKIAYNKYGEANISFMVETTKWR